MKKQIIGYCILLFGMLIIPGLSLAQEVDAVPELVDDIQVDVKNVSVDAKTKTLTLDLFLISYQKNPREFKLNTFATQVLDTKGQTYMYSTMQMGKVLIKLSDRQNYLHYFMEDEVPVAFKITVDNWTKGNKAKAVKLVFEDSTEAGKFIEKAVNL
ncbi:Uncharacterised protein [Sphingobacterium spiritivorum]|uniref:NEAT domain-containing protein n=1 Tax=Sphingobacterium spiritivorum TaxID=258 RepID=A0A380C677_SPHSI|nr:hypothetical protein [Sphingobacterium spiritivorum]SUJ13975.1 Uncharacterised protein [Sphingobacterium spiritivorum]